ncbi:hypothetical protein SAMN04488074_112111 [Lentzea albidocapillata subsp. violacea]|uniref:Metal-dependent hydrolase, beta-lactamase superfamily II n=2 Tax=Lentzea albidocapillata TaxID=40571 RepID=A0A1G9LM98_9PSEU|nr:hypothetical protein SAMN04488074_112111 [Lentzea albidocapillata subsp. violacea]
MINDSCLNATKSRPAALEYLEGIGVDCGSSVDLVVASHWHDDHIRGMAQVVDTCSSATFVCSTALRSDEFVQLVSAAEPEMSLGSGLSEFRKVMDIVVGRRNSGVQNPVKFAQADMTIWSNPNRPAVRVHTLSPSSASTLHTFQEIGALIPSVESARLRVPKVQPNDTSVVVWVEFEFEQALLGADLEVVADDARGWAAICDSATRPNGSAGVYKVAHHGSVTGHYDGIYAQLLSALPISVLAPFSRGRTILPTEADRERLCSHSSEVYSTNTKISPVRLPRERLVGKTLKESNNKVEVVDPSFGHIRLRRRTDDPTWRVELRGHAGALCVA